MTTIKHGNTPMQRILAGNKVLSAADAVDSSPIAQRIATFRAIQLKYVAAHNAVKLAADAREEQRAKIVELDGRQDIAVEELANLLPGDGFSRRNPFKPFGAPSPSVLCKMPMVKEAAQVLALEKSVLKASTVSEDSADAARAAGHAARLVLKGVAPLSKLEAAKADATAKRDALLPAWEMALAQLKRGAKAAEDEGHTGLFASLFDVPSKPKKATGKKQPIVAPPATA